MLVLLCVLKESGEWNHEGREGKKQKNENFVFFVCSVIQIRYAQ